MSKVAKTLVRLLSFIALALLPLVLIPALERATLNPNGSLTPTAFKGLIVVFAFFGGLLLFGTGLWMAVAGKNVRPLAYCVFAALFFASAMFGTRRSIELRRQGFADLSERSKPLIQAIQRFEKREGRLPTALQELVPAYLPEVPATGLGAYPRYEWVDPKTARDLHKTEWALRVQATNGLMSFDQFLYHSNLEYPKKGFGGNLERIGDWAYVHE